MLAERAELTTESLSTESLQLLYRNAIEYIEAAVASGRLKAEEVFDENGKVAGDVALFFVAVIVCGGGVLWGIGQLIEKGEDSPAGAPVPTIPWAPGNNQDETVAPANPTALPDFGAASSATPIPAENWDCTTVPQRVPGIGLLQTLREKHPGITFYGPGAYQGPYRHNGAEISITANLPDNVDVGNEICIDKTKLSATPTPTSHLDSGSLNGGLVHNRKFRERHTTTVYQAASSQSSAIPRHF